MNLFYSKHVSGDKIFLSENESHHCMHVLRNNINDEIVVIDGKGREYICKIIDFNKKQVTAKCIKNRKISRPLNLPHLAISPLKSQDRIEWLIEKSIEIGVSKISFLKTLRTERSKVNMNRINKIAVSAMKQSRQYYLPIISEVVPFEIFLASVDEKHLFIAHLNDVKPTKHLADLCKENIKSCILIGPEGDFTQEEVKLAASFNFTPVSLGNSTLRTETSGIYALSILTTFNNASRS